MKKPTDEIFKKIEEEIARRGGTVGSLDELNQIARQVSDDHNESPHPDFEGLTPSQMYYIVNDPASEQVVGIRDVTDSQIVTELPIIRTAEIILNHIDFAKGLKLTATGKLPRKVVGEIHSTGLFKSEYERILPPKVINEDDFIPAGLGHHLLRVAGFVRMSKNKIILTRKGKKATEDPMELFSGLYRAFSYRFNKAWFDYYESEEIGNVGFGFVIYLLSRYGDEIRSSDFYAEKYFRAYPMLPVLTARFPKPNEHCFETRVFSRGLFLFGLVDRITIKSNGYMKDYKYRRSKAFENVFTVKL